MSLVSVKNHLTQWNAENRVQELPASSATVADAAKALGCKEEEIAKTMSFKVEEQVVLVVMAGDVKVANSKFKAQFHTKPKMLKGEEVEALTGHPPGGVCPFGAHDDVDIYLDESLKRFDKVYPACGSGNSAIELTLQELELFSQFKDWVDVSKSAGSTKKSEA